MWDRPVRLSLISRHPGPLRRHLPAFERDPRLQHAVDESMLILGHHYNRNDIYGTWCDVLRFFSEDLATEDALSRLYAELEKAMVNDLRGWIDPVALWQGLFCKSLPMFQVLAAISRVGQSTTIAGVLVEFFLNHLETILEFDPNSIPSWVASIHRSDRTEDLAFQAIDHVHIYLHLVEHTRFEYDRHLQKDREIFWDLVAQFEDFGHDELFGMEYERDYSCTRRLRHPRAPVDTLSWLPNGNRRLNSALDRRSAFSPAAFPPGNSGFVREPHPDTTKNAIDRAFKHAHEDVMSVVDNLVRGNSLHGRRPNPLFLMSSLGSEHRHFPRSISPYRSPLMGPRNVAPIGA